MKKSIVSCIRYAFLILILFINLYPIFADKKSIISNSGSKYSLIDTGKIILLLPPEINYVSLANEKKLDLGKEGEELKMYIENFVVNMLENRGIQYKKTNQIEGDSLAYDNDLSVIMNNSRSMFKTYIGDIFQKAAKSFDEKSGYSVVMLIICDAKVGAGGSWNPNSGAITSKNHQTILKAVLFSTSTCKKLWFNEILLRELPKIGDKDFEKSLNSLFINLKL